VFVVEGNYPAQALARFYRIRASIRRTAFWQTDVDVWRGNTLATLWAATLHTSIHIRGIPVCNATWSGFESRRAGPGKILGTLEVLVVVFVLRNEDDCYGRSCVEIYTQRSICMNATLRADKGTL